ncbi:hypothetical protein AGMMS49546_26800 [Spirochaetia bacterium]|nr:hypothetical protein AGMMS49546_26800 [Spirochaetia bacterium]
MMTLKRLTVLCLVSLTAVSMVMGQNSDKKSNSNLLALIREQSRSNSRDQKLAALENIRDAIDGGNRGEEIRSALEYLALDGAPNKASAGVNSDVRVKAATCLGDLGTPEAKNTLVKIVMADSEPVVLTEVVKSLAKLGINDSEETVNTIVWIMTRSNDLNPDNDLAFSSVEAIERLAEANGGIKNPNAVTMLVRITSGPHSKPVQDRAKEAFANLRKYAAQAAQNR